MLIMQNLSFHVSSSRTSKGDIAWCSAWLEGTAALADKGITSFLVSLYGIPEPQTDQTSEPPGKEKAALTHCQCNRDRDLGGGFQVSCQLALATLSPPQEVFQYKWD